MPTYMSLGCSGWACGQRAVIRTTRGSRAMREANLTEGRIGRELGYAAEGWRPLAQQLAARFAPTGGSDEGMIQAAIGVILAVERRLGSRGPELISLVVPLVIRALRRHRR